MKNMRDYILRKFKYKELGISFTKKMRGAIDSLKQFPKGYTEEEKKITLLRVLQEGMKWRKMIEEWIVEN